MSDERDRTASGAGEYDHRTHRWRNPEIEKALNEMASERAVKERRETDKNIVRDEQATTREAGGRRHKGPNPEVWDALQQMADEAARGTAEQNQHEPEDWHAVWETANAGPVMEPRETTDVQERQDAIEQKKLETGVQQDEQSILDKESEMPEIVDKENVANIDEQEEPAGESQEVLGTMPTEVQKAMEAIDAMAARLGREVKEIMDTPIDQDLETEYQEESSNKGQEKEYTTQKQNPADRTDAGAESQQQKDKRDEEPFRKGGKKQDPDKEKTKGLFSRFRGFVVRVYHRVKHAMERAIGRGRIPTMPLVNKAYFSRTTMDLSGKDKPSVDRAAQEKFNEKGRNWGELFYHGFARRLLGKDAYMYALQQGDRQETSKQGRKAQDLVRPDQSQKGTNGKESRELAGRAESPAGQEKPEQPGNTDAHEQGVQDKKEIQQKGLEEMKGKFNSLHKVINKGLEDKFSNAREAKEAYLGHYARLLQEKLTEMNHGESVQVSAVRGNGKLEIRINDKPEQYGGYPSFMGCSKIRVEIDGHLNIISAEAFVPTRQTDDGKFVGRKIDVSNTLGAYIISDLAKNFREDYNRGAECYNLSSRKEFEKTIMTAAAQSRSEFAIDNINYSISVKDNQIQISQAAGGKTFTVAMGADPREIEVAKETYEASVEKIQEAERKLETAKSSYKDLAEKYRQNQENYREAETKAVAAKQKHKDASIKLNNVQKQLSGRYPGAERMDELKTQEKKAMGVRNEAFKESKDAGMEKNLAQAELEKTGQQMKRAREQIVALEHEAATLKDVCREAKEQYDSASLAQKDATREIYQAHAKSVMEGRESSIRAFEEILLGCKNDIGGSLGLEDLGRVMEETGRTSMEEVLNGQVKDGQEAPSLEEGRRDGLESQEISAELE